MFKTGCYEMRFEGRPGTKRGLFIPKAKSVNPWIQISEKMTRINKLNGQRRHK